ncbi:anti-sigma-I factor RsgI2-like [Melanotaenia boesemani]|uniref:anti-sigma-I factor RsgI2-like n=1 Tax=Melanotaenia boesemani TaxID=1250792 RepID=UPI001C03C0E3|nr:anti-sigma-I factor RsgI2-like [Melanotaenia boesemani]
MHSQRTHENSNLMRMKMKNKLLFFSTVMVIVSTLGVADSISADWKAYPTTAWTTRGPGLNLNGKMFTLSGYRGGLCFYSPYRPSPWYSTPYPSRRFTTPDYTPTSKPGTPDYTSTSKPGTPDYTPTSKPGTPDYTPTSKPGTPDYTPTSKPGTPDYTPTSKPGTPYYTPTSKPGTPDYTPTSKPGTPDYTPTSKPGTPYYTPTSQPGTPYMTATTLPPATKYTTTYPPWTTAPTTRGVSVCLRYITDYLQTSSPSIFTLSPSSTPLRLDVMNVVAYTLTFNGYNSMYLKPSIRLRTDIGQSMWTSVCLTVDSMKGVVQMFSNTNMSMRKVLPSRYVWSGEPVIDFTGFEGQVTDIEVWDYPLCYKQVLYYMSRGTYGPYQGSVLTWSNINYSLRGNTLLEDSYEQQMKQPANRGARGRRLKGRKMDRKFFNNGEINETKTQLI